MQVMVIGGGITGLATAYELTRLRVPFVLLEASPRLGGLIRTDHVDGFTIEAGADAMLVQKPAALQLCDELGLRPRLISTTPPRTAYVLKDGCLYPLPSRSILGIPLTWRGIAAYDLLPWRARVRLALEPLVRRRSQDDESVASFFTRRFGPATVDLIADPLLGVIHAGRIDALSIQSLFPRLTDAERRRGSVLRALRRTHPASQGEGLFRSLSSGMNEIVNAIRHRLPDGSVRLNTPATSVTSAEDGWRVTCGGSVVTARAIIIAAPAPVAATLFQQIDSEAAALCAEVPYVSTVSVALAWPDDRVGRRFEGSGFVVARKHNALRISACTWVSSKWAARAPTGFALFRAFVGGALDPEAVNLSDDELIAIATRDIGSVVSVSGPPTLARVYRWRDAGAQHNVGQLARMTKIEARLAQLPGVFVAGSGFRSIGVPDCVADGRAAASAAAGYIAAALT